MSPPPAVGRVPGTLIAVSQPSFDNSDVTAFGGPQWSRLHGSRNTRLRHSYSPNSAEPLVGHEAPETDRRSPACGPSER